MTDHLLNRAGHRQGEDPFVIVIIIIIVHNFGLKRRHIAFWPPEHTNSRVFVKTGRKFYLIYLKNCTNMLNSTL